MFKFRSTLYTFKNKFFYILCAFFILLTSSKLINQEKSSQLQDDTIHLAKNALKGLVVEAGLEVQVFATEPMLKNPTNIDVDERGRVWVTEAYNYRPEITGNPTNEKGDRIVILEDTNGDGVADTAKVFYQGPEINSPLGITVLGNKVLVSQSPYVWAFYDDDGDDKADRKEIIFQGIGGEQHDHGMHTFIFGPDGKLYFNFGNEGKTLKDKNGNPVRDQDGDVIGPEKYKQGMIFRSDADGTNVECLADNFRNNYELAVDSYGGIWQSDNDDDGNRGTRINYVMEYGNYGYTDEMTGASWSANRTNREDSIPLRHWHLNDPGVVPNLLQTGAGSPSGILIYEGSLLPSQFRNQLIHAEPGKNVVRSYSVKKNDAGYTAEIINILNGEHDKWFRPADVCIAPDGSLIVADWYDPGVGGHQAGDQQKGRIYRGAPKGSKYTIQKQDYTSPEGAVIALQNPNLAVRYLAWEALAGFGKKAVPALEKLWKSSQNPRMRARAFWILVKNNDADKYINQAIKEDNPDLRMLAIRAARQNSTNLMAVIAKLVNDKDPQVRRECAIALHHNQSPQMPSLWAKLAVQHDGKDRWYLEALGIGAAEQWDKCFIAYNKLVPDPLKTQAGKDIVWRARTDKAVPYLAQLASDPSMDLKSRLRYFRAFDFNSGPAKGQYLLAMIEANKAKDIGLNKLIINHLDSKTILQSKVGVSALEEVLKSVNGSMEYLGLVRRHSLNNENQNLLDLIVSGSNESFARNAVGLLLDLKGIDLVNTSISNDDTEKAIKIINALGGVGSRQSISILQNIALSSSYNDNIRFTAANKIGASMGGEDQVLVLLKEKKIPEELIPQFVDGLKRAWRKAIYLEAKTYLPDERQVIEKKELPILKELNALTTDIEKGKVVFQNNCSICHQVNKEGFEFGPALSEIGTKLPKEAILEAIVQPSAGISFGYETWQLQMKDGSVYAGIIANKTETDIELLYPAGIKYNIKASDVKSMKQMPGSMMPAGMHESMSKQELADMLAYLSELK
jgi:putative membrane-bound dehydrogenase-like protein